MVTVSLADKTFEHNKNGCISPFHSSNNLQWDRNNIGDILVVTETKLMENPSGNDKTVVLIIEPKELIPGIYDYVFANHANYDLILSHHADVLKLPNGAIYEFGSSWIPKEDVKIYNKTKAISMITTDKNWISGHKFRMGIVGRLKEYFDLYGKGFSLLNSKTDGLRDYMFSIAVENTNQDYFFTEKIIDCFATGTIPIYWGTSKVDEYFNPNGIIKFHSIGQLHRILTTIDESWYEKRIDAVKENFERCQEFLATEDRIYRALNGRGLV